MTLGGDTTIGSDAGTLTLNSATPLSGTNTNLTFSGAGNGIISSAINTGTGGLTKNGTGSLTLAGTNTFTGPTTINTGTLVYNSVGALSSSSALTWVRLLPPPTLPTTARAARIRRP